MNALKLFVAAIVLIQSTLSFAAPSNVNKFPRIVSYPNNTFIAQACTMDAQKKVECQNLGLGYYSWDEVKQIAKDQRHKSYWKLAGGMLTISAFAAAGFFLVPMGMIVAAPIFEALPGIVNFALWFVVPALTGNYVVNHTSLNPDSSWERAVQLEALQQQFQAQQVQFSIAEIEQILSSLKPVAPFTLAAPAGLSKKLN